MKKRVKPKDVNSYGTASVSFVGKEGRDNVLFATGTKFSISGTDDYPTITIHGNKSFYWKRGPLPAKAPAKRKKKDQQ